jgi:hypothetical protein
MDKAFPGAIVSSYESLIADIILPDKGDRHVLAAAIKGEAKIVITNNLKHFPNKYLKTYHIEAQTPDKFIKHLITLDKTRVVEAFRSQVSRLKNPPLSDNQVLAALRKCGLTDAADIIKSLLKL